MAGLEEYGNLPFNLEAEQSLLGAILIDPGLIATVLDSVSSECFYKEEHRGIFSVMTRLFASGSPIDLITVLEGVKAEEIFDSDETAKRYLTELLSIVPSLQNAETYLRIVKEKYYLRMLIETAGEIISESSEPGSDATSMLDAAEQRIFEIRQGRDAKGLRRIDEVIISSYDRLQRISSGDKDRYLGIPTGFSRLDAILTGLNRSDLVLIAGRPGMGKTSFALNIAEYVAMKKQKKVVIFSLEMSTEQLVERMLSSQASIVSKALRTGTLAPDEWTRLASAADLLSKAEILLDDSSGITVPEMKAKLRRQRDVDLVVIDYLQLMSSGRRTENRVAEISEMTRSLKLMAKELSIPVITLSQLSRGPESRSDHRPMLSDLRESGSIEQDADVVLFLYREGYYNQAYDQQNVSECIVAKNRHGETGTVELAWDGQYTRFSNLETFRDEQ